MNQAADALLALYQVHAASIPRYLWQSEDDRWLELLVCLLSRLAGVSVADARNLALIWRHLGLVSPGFFAALRDDSPEATLLSFTLTRIGVTPEQVPRCLAMLRSVSTSVDSMFQGKIQLFLRKHAELMRSELTDLLADSGLGPDALKIAITHWLQNVTSAPLTLEDESTRKFCASYGITMADLERIADQSSLNLALVDDVITLADEQL